MFGPSNFDFAFALYGLPPGPPPSNTVAECGEWSTTLLPLPDGATATPVYASKSFGADETWLVGGYDTGSIGSFQTFSLAYHRVGDGAWDIVPTPSPDVCSRQRQSEQLREGLVQRDRRRRAGRSLGRRLEDAQTHDGFFGGEIFLAHWDGTEWIADSCAGHDRRIGRRNRRHQGDRAGRRLVRRLLDRRRPMARARAALEWLVARDASSRRSRCRAARRAGRSCAVDGVAADDLWAVGAGSDGDMSLSPYVLHWDGSALAAHAKTCRCPATGSSSTRCCRSHRTTSTPAAAGSPAASATAR